MVTIIRKHYPRVQAVYLFGSIGTEFEREDSDIDLALLFPAVEAKAIGHPALSECWSELTSATGRPVDLVNIRLVNTVFQHEIIQTGRILFNADKTAVDFFEMMTMSFYQRLNYERKAILEEIMQSKRVLNV
ncbi:MAG: nucleotidyltransferase domain-containing protein [Deltaproteobacteria bacterium]|nr:nucleotidyltransferase domain-containing protein [Deltaproteobacteria bacterium]